MSEQNDGRAAFPQYRNGQFGGMDRTADGMSLRDYFAAKAMQALIAKIPLHDAESEHGESSDIDNNHAIRIGVAESAYDYADAMLAERKES